MNAIVDFLRNLYSFMKLLDFSGVEVSFCLSHQQCVLLLISQSCSTLSRPQGLQLLVSQSIGLPGQDDWSGLPFPSAGIFLA